MKRLIALVVLVAAPAALANYPVFDATNFAKMVEQVRITAQQLQQAKATYESLQALHGTRNLGAVLYNPALRQYLPEQWAGVYDAVAAGRYAGISGSVRDIERAEQLTGTVAEQIDRMRQRSRTTAVANKALGLRAFDGAKARLQQIESLMQQVNMTKDAKGVAEIQARIAIEQAAVQNETTKLQLIQMLQAAEEKLQAQQRQAAAEKILDPTITGMPACCSAR
jgi:type IV secretion system protein VirB5